MKDPQKFGDALLTEMHGSMGCDPNCVKRYHDVFNGRLTLDAFADIVGPSVTSEEWDQILKEGVNATTQSTGR